MESSRQNWTFINYLMASPFANGTKLNLSEAEFFKTFFVPILSWDKKKEELDKHFETAGYQMIRPVFLFGYRGTGKTTFIRWYIKNSTKLSKYTPLFLDMNDVSPQIHNPKTGFTIFEIYLRDKIISFHAESTIAFNTFLFHIISLNSGKIRAKSFSDDFFDKLYILTDKILDENNSFKKSISLRTQLYEVDQFIIDLRYDDLLLLLLLLYDYDDESKLFFNKVLNCQRVSDKPFLIIVFDNIDHIRIESSNADFPSIIEEVYYRYQNVFQILRGFDKEPLSIHFIFSLRDTNRQLLNIQNLSMDPIEIEFVPSSKFEDILKRRIDIAYNENKINENFCSFLKSFFSDRITKEVFLSLFNFDNRKLAEFVSDWQLYSQNYKETVESLFERQRQNQRVLHHVENNGYSSGYSNGARGIYYFLIIKKLLRNNFLREGLLIDTGDKVVEEGGYLNPARIILTIIHNMSNFSIDLEKLDILGTRPQGLYNVFYEYWSLFKVDKLRTDVYEKRLNQFFDIISALFLFHRDNWVHLITFTGKQVYDKSVFDTEKLRLKANIKDPTFIEELNKIKVQLNPSGYMYLNKIIVHYEYFSIRVKNEKPLFSSIALIKQADGYTPEFYRNIDKTWEKVGPCLDSLITFIKSDLAKEVDFINSFHCYKEYIPGNSDYVEVPGTKRLLIVRIIHTHLRYLDNFREYIMNYNLKDWGDLDFTIDGELVDKNKIKETINQSLVKRQIRYIDKLRNLCIIENINVPKDLLISLEQNLKWIQNTDYLNYKHLLNERSEV